MQYQRQTILDIRIKILLLVLSLLHVLPVNATSGFLEACADFHCLNGGTCGSDGCECPSGFSGYYCEEEDCPDGPCLNYGYCRPNGNRCRCVDDFYGPYCEYRDLCPDTPCENGGMCIVSTLGEYQCHCADGYSGERCETEVCPDQFCQNNGTCVHVNGDNYCNCLVGWEGTNCEMAISTACENLTPCLNGGTCYNVGSNEYTCVCPADFTDTNCGRSVVSDPCVVLVPCDNNGLCLYLGASYDIDFVCVCTAGFTGPFCSEELNPCANFVCFNGGSCFINGYVPYCSCSDGWTGTYCNVSSMTTSNPCETVDPCLNGGVCLSGENGLYCVCTSSWTGIYCESSLVDYCVVEPCLNDGVCISLTTTHTCVCRVGWTETYCQTSLSVACEERTPCENGAICQNEGLDDYSCACGDGWKGTNCEVDVNECVNTGICGQGECINTDGSYECDCFDNWTGDNCDMQLPYCTTNPCLNGGSCVDHAKDLDSYTCNCTTGWNGDQCQTDINECERTSPVCGDSGTCINTDGSFFCDCLEGFGGDLCDVQAASSALSSDQIIIIGAASGGLLLIVIIIVICACICSRNSASKRGNAQDNIDGLGQPRPHGIAHENPAYEPDHTSPSEPPPEYEPMGKFPSPSSTIRLSPDNAYQIPDAGIRSSPSVATNGYLRPMDAGVSPGPEKKEFPGYQNYLTPNADTDSSHYLPMDEGRNSGHAEGDEYHIYEALPDDALYDELKE
ncbi:fibropellin-1 isoform X4 [Strongylocentrotus purpuratus]|uniref:EGF-like domain-containing protein n=1 Tax=Strongylocentrotus purpuratus TaxID=7668 RepID=A0A7M7T1X9_STRPU|nr:fibropellin-1 isoform X4 [Strongylocentrotus purpuratus]